MEEIGADKAKAEILTKTLEEAKEDDLAYIDSYSSKSNLFSFALVAISIIVTIIMSTSLIKVIKKSVAQLSDAAKEIALGHVDVEMVKYNNDEFW